MKQLLSKGGNCVTQSSVGVNHQNLLVPGDKNLNQIGNRKLLFCRGVFLLTGIAQYTCTLLHTYTILYIAVVMTFEL